MHLEDPTRENSAGLVGRSSEIQCLSGVIRGLSIGRGAVLDIAGDPGIGKTSLLELLARQAAAAGAGVIRVRAVRGARESGQVIKQVLAALDVRQRIALSDFGVEEDSGVRSSLERWAAVRGGVLLLNSMHLCDEQSATSIARLLRTPPSGPFVLALAHRPRQSSALLMEALEHGVETGGIIRLTPSPLDLQATYALLRRQRSHADSTALCAFSGTDSRERQSTERRASWESLDETTYVEQLHAASRGNPRIVQILAAARWDPDEWPLAAGPDRDGLRRASVSVITEFNSLTPDAVTSAEVASVLGDRFVLHEVATISGLGLTRTIGAFAELTAADLIRPLPWGGEYAFRHPVLGHVILEHAPPSLRLNAHRVALDLLTARWAPAVERAPHAEYLVGSGSITALNVLTEGAAEAMATTPATAARWLRLALDHLPTGTRISAARAALTLDCCRALTAVGRLQEARALSHDLLRHRSDLSDDLAALAYAACGEVERLLGRYQEAEGFVDAALNLLPQPLPVPLPQPTAELIAAYGRVQMFRETYSRARDLVRDAVKAADSTDPMAPYLRALAVLGDTQLGLLNETAPEVTACARLVDALPDATAATMSEVLAMLGCTELFHERIHDAYRHLERGLEATTGASRRYGRINQLVALCHLDQLTGRLEDLDRRAREAERLARMIGSDEGAGIAMALQATGLLWTRPRRDTARVIGIAEEGLSLAVSKYGLRASVTAGLLAQVQFLGGDPQGSLRTLVEAGGPKLHRLLRPWRPSLLALASTAALRCGDMDAAHSWAAEADAAAGQLSLPLQRLHVRRAQAEVHAAAGEHEVAAGLFHEVAESFRRAGVPVEHAWTLVAGTCSAQLSQGTDQALEWLDTAAKAARSCGAQRIIEEAAKARTQLLAFRAAGASAAMVRDANPDTTTALLTKREHEIAVLAATGKSNKDIAEQLFLSNRTVESHLGSIYRKLGVRSRVALSHALRQLPAGRY